MKYLIATAIGVFMFYAHSIQAQKGEWREKIESQKIAFITKKLDLGPKEAQDFWPLYNEHQETKKKMLNGERRIKTDYEQLSEEEARAEIDRRLQTRYELQQLNADYTRRYLDVIPAKKVLALERAEREFRKEMLQRIRRGKNRAEGGRMRQSRQK